MASTGGRSGADGARERYHHGDLHAAMVATAAGMLEEVGIARLSLRETARSVGVSHAAPYRHFRNKQALLEAVAVAGFDELVETVLRAVASHPDDPFAQLRVAARAYIEVALRSPQRAHLMFGGHLDRETCSESFRDASTTAFRTLRSLIRAGQGAGAFRGGSTRDLALYLWSAIHGLAVLAVARQLDPLMRDGEGLDGLRDTVVEQVLAGLGAGPSPPCPRR